MGKATLNTHLVATGLKRVFLSPLLTAKDQMCGKVLVWLPMKRMNEWLDFTAC